MFQIVVSCPGRAALLGGGLLTLWPRCNSRAAAVLRQIHDLPRTSFPSEKGDAVVLIDVSCQRFCNAMVQSMRKFIPDFTMYYSTFVSFLDIEFGRI